MRIGLITVLVLAAGTPAPLIGQSPLRVSVGGAAGAAGALGDTRASYGGGWFGWGDLSFHHAGSRLALRAEVSYLRLRGARDGDIFFPALNVIGFSAGAVRSFAVPGSRLAPYLAASIGAYNTQDALPFADYRTGLGARLALGTTARIARARWFAEAGLTNVFGPGPHLMFASLLVGVRAGRP